MRGFAMQMGLSFACIFVCRFVGGIYQQVWRYGGIQCYIRLLFVDGVAFVLNWLFERFLPETIVFPYMVSIATLNVLASLTIRMIYRYTYKCANMDTAYGRFLWLLFRVAAGKSISYKQREEHKKTNIAIIGAGRLGVILAEELLNSPDSEYVPRCFVDINRLKVDRTIHNIPVLLENESVFQALKEFDVEEVVFTLPHIDAARKKQLYEQYLHAGFHIKVYELPVAQPEGNRAKMRDFDISDMLFRKPLDMGDTKTAAYYKDKVIMITGGGGSIGSELCRQLAAMQPRQIIILDVYENGAYDVQQELRITYGAALDIRIEITSICNRTAMMRVFEAYRPQIVINAAAHKHVPLMEHNCIEAVENNVFGTVTLIELCEQYGVERFMMVSTDKAVNPTNVMGATKRMCEMIVGCASANGKVKYSSTRFGNVLGSAGSVIPLFKKQIASGGPITLTDKRIIRYFMTIPEASQLVLASGALAENGELFVLDMGQPVKIYDLAQNMIKLMGAKDINIVEIGLRPGEKLYEELLINTEELEKTENELIFIERDTPYAREEITEKLCTLRAACDSGSDAAVKAALHEVIPTFRTSEEVNSRVIAQKESHTQGVSA